jgi:hypothetical protein
MTALVFFLATWLGSFGGTPQHESNADSGQGVVVAENVTVLAMNDVVNHPDIWPPHLPAE